MKIRLALIILVLGEQAAAALLALLSPPLLAIPAAPRPTAEPVPLDLLNLDTPKPKTKVAPGLLRCLRLHRCVGMPAG